MNPSVQCASFDPLTFTRGGPPRKMVPCFLTMMLSSAMAGTYAPPAVQEPSTTAIYKQDIQQCKLLLDPHLRYSEVGHIGLIVKNLAKMLAVRENLSLAGQVGSTTAIKTLSNGSITLMIRACPQDKCKAVCSPGQSAGLSGAW